MRCRYEKVIIQRVSVPIFSEEWHDDSDDLETIFSTMTKKQEFCTDVLLGSFAQPSPVICDCILKYKLIFSIFFVRSYFEQ